MGGQVDETRAEVGDQSRQEARERGLAAIGAGIIVGVLRWLPDRECERPHPYAGREAPHFSFESEESDG